jgi:hypothetical protein
MYDVLDINGARVRDLTAVTFASKAEGVDFEVDYKLGRVRFLTSQTASVTPSITAAAIASGDANSLYGLTPLSQNVFQGIGRLVVFDENRRNQIALAHEDFGCEVEIDGGADVKTDDYSDLSLMVSVTNPLGKHYIREA